jgi:glutathione S-transferase
MAIEIFWFSGSPHAWRVLLTAALKDVKYTSRLLEASKGEHRTPEYLAMNPRAKVPVLRDGDVVVAESLAIMAYLDRRFPSPALFGGTNEEAAEIWARSLDFDNNVRLPVGQLARAIFQQKPDELPTAAQAAVVRQEMATLETRLHNRSWLVGSAISVADLTVYPHVEVLLRAAERPAASALDLGILPLAQSHPGIAAWRDRVRALPGYDATYPPHWR